MFTVLQHGKSLKCCTEHAIVGAENLLKLNGVNQLAHALYGDNEE